LIADGAWPICEHAASSGGARPRTRAGGCHGGDLRQAAGARALARRRDPVPADRAKIALAPLFLIWFGSASPRSWYRGVAGVLPGDGRHHGRSRLGRPAADRLARLLQLSPWRRLRRIELPAAAPSLFAGLKVGACSGGRPILASDVEPCGLGYLMVSASGELSHAAVVREHPVHRAARVAVYQAVAAAERAALSWREP